ncbi:MAG: polymer-forming cytoskeletal protein [Candidatus Aminicenantes bacterium]|nr:polymer-forming cytoskeletal protein [Candidatus Aminicenantes bacterium]
MNRRLEDKYGIITTVIAPNTRFDGMINATEGVQISGYFEGEVISQSLVWIGKTGKVEGNITSPSVISEGEIVGDIESAKHVELRAECRMTGNISTEKLAIADGCSFKGEVRMLQKGDKPVRFTEKRKESKKT